MERKNFLKIICVASPVLIIPKQSLFFQNNNLPNILIIGDSISIGYTPFVKKSLNGKAEIHRPLLETGANENCAGTTNGLQNIDRWIGEKKWDIIHFNFGLHDIKHVDPTTGKNSNNPKHPQQADIKQYKKNLIEIVKKLNATGAALIFATTTPYPETVNNPHRKPGMPSKYNRAAIKIMNKNNIAINDLYAFMLPRMNELQRPNNVHFTPEGSKALADKVVDRINEAIED